MTLILDEILKTKGVSATALAAMMEAKGYKLSKVSISNILTGKHSPKVETLENIADTLNISVSEFFDSYLPESMKPIYQKNDDGTFEEIGYIKQ